MIDPTNPHSKAVVRAQILEEMFRREALLLIGSQGSERSVRETSCLDLLSQMRDLCLQEFQGSSAVLEAISELEVEIAFLSRIDRPHSSQVCPGCGDLRCENQSGLQASLPCECFKRLIGALGKMRDDFGLDI